MTALSNYQAGYRLIDGTKLNKMVAVVNNLSGNGTPQAITGTTGSFSGIATASGFAGNTATTASNGLAAAQGGSNSLIGGASSTSANAGGAASIVGGAPGATGVGGAASVTGGAGGATSGAGGLASVSGGAGTAGNANGGDVTLAGGIANGTGVNGVVRSNGIEVNLQPNPSVLNATGTLTAAEMLAGIVTSTSAAAVAATLDIATNLDLALPTSVANDSFDFSIINTGPSTLTVGTAAGWTLVGTMTVVTAVSGRFRARKTGAGAWVLYRLS